MSHPNTTPYELSAQDLKRFHQSYYKSVVIDCWLWIAGRDPDGYGIFYMRQPFPRATKASRVACFVFTGIQPAEQLVCHKCDTPSCVNPEHLFLGSHQANSDDAVAKGRKVRGIRQHLAKLTDEKVREIRRLNKEEGIGCHRLARMFQVTPSNIKCINRGITWKHLL